MTHQKVLKGSAIDGDLEVSPTYYAKQRGARDVKSLFAGTTARGCTVAFCPSGGWTRHSDVSTSELRLDIASQCYSSDGIDFKQV